MVSSLLMLIIFLVGIALSVPIAACLGISSAVALSYDNIPMLILAQRMFKSIYSYPLMAVLFFMFAGEVMCKGTMTQKLIGFFESVIGHIHGGLAVAGGLSAAFFSAISGSSAATCASIGTIMIGEMEKKGYPKDYAAAVVASAAITGIVIPPSITLVIYGVVTGTSVGKLFVAGIVPGLFLSFTMCCLSYYLSRKNGYGERGKFSFRFILTSIKKSFLVLLMPLIILGGIYGGVFTPTEASVVSVVYALAITGLVDRSLSRKALMDISIKTVINSAVVLFIMQTADAFSWVLTNARVPHMIGAMCADLSQSKIIFLMIFNVVLLIAGCLLNGAAIVAILAPILTPVAVTYGIDPIFLGVLMVVNLAIGYITPPLGVDLYVAGSIAKLPVDSVIRRIIPYLLLLLIDLLIITYLPAMTLWLPNMMK